MTKVRENAEKIFDALVASGEHSQMLNPSMKKMVSAAAQFHDIADHKYVKDPHSLGIEEELRKHFSDKASASLMKVMEAVSFSKERKLRKAANAPTTPISFEATLGKAGCLLRDIVSDADKLEAIGSIGVQRCLQYSKESAVKTTGVEPTQTQLIKDLVVHGEEKLFIMLKHHYIRTSAGRSYANGLHTIMLNEVCSMLADQPDEIKRLHATYDILPSTTSSNSNPNTSSSSSSTLPAASPAPNSQSSNGTPGTAAVAASSATSSSSSSSSSSEPVKKKRRVISAMGGSYHNAGNTPVVQNGMITGFTKRLNKIGEMTDLNKGEYGMDTTAPAIKKN